MKKFEPLQQFIQKRIDEAERLKRAKSMANKESQATSQFDAMYGGKSTDQSMNFDRMEINSYMELR